MKDLNYNMLKHDPLSKDPLEVDEYTFFKYYLELLQVKAGKFLSSNELDVLAYVLAGETGKSYFKRPTSKEIEEFFEINTNHFHQIKYNLEQLGIIKKTEIRGDYILHKRFAEFQKDMKERFQNNSSISFDFKLKVK